MRVDDVLKELISRYGQLTTRRAVWEPDWQTLRDYVNPLASDVTRRTSEGVRLTTNMYDGTAPWALEQLASGLCSFLTSPTERWFNIGVEDYDYLQDDEALTWLERVSDI